MKIVEVETFVIKADLDKPFAFSQGWVHQRTASLVRITADNGLQGWGEAFAQGLEPPEIAAAAITHALRPHLLERNPLDTSVIWHELYALTRDYGRKGSVMAAISAVDIALWDIAGQFLGQPVHRLLGGAYRDSVRPYATGFYRLQGCGEADRLAQEAQAHKTAGFTAMKIKLGFSLNDDLQVMQSIVEALDDSSIELMVDTNHAYGRRDARTLGEALADYPLRWYEEPVVPEDIDGYAELRQVLSVPIAGGENEHSAFGFNDLFQRKALDVAQPDIGSCGGFTAIKEILALAHANGVSVNPHVWGSAIAQAASMQIIAALPSAHPRLIADEPLLEYDLSDHPFREQLIDKPLRIASNGRVPVSQEPGLGITVDMGAILEFS
ncbi:MAG: mandelate racemase/muconate lactonizing enzyme family protein [Granulosicoccus sp.]|nr:mandelate racemase/muconate lactonizing enzyme family protein [Granulosicoccus sp.]